MEPEFSVLVNVHSFFNLVKDWRVDFKKFTFWNPKLLFFSVPVKPSLKRVEPPDFLVIDG
jgi:hypothetical protein